MLFNCKLTHIDSSVPSQSQLALHPSKAIIATEASQTLEIHNFRIGGLKTALDIHQNIDQLEFSPCGNYILTITERSKGVQVLTLLDWERKQKVSKIEIKVSDPKKLIPIGALIQYEYSKVILNQLNQIWILQNYNLKNGNSGGYSFHFLEFNKKQELSEVFTQYISGYDNAIMVRQIEEQQKSIDIKSQIKKFMIAEKQNLKTFEYNTDDKALRLVKQMKVQNEIQQIEILNYYQIIYIINNDGDLQAIYTKGGLVYEQKAQESFGKFTCFAIKGNLIYCGTEKGHIIVFDSLKGTYVKSIPFQQKLFKKFQLTERFTVSSIKSLQINSIDNLLIYYADNSFVLLDQSAKQILKLHQGFNNSLSNIQQLPLLNSECFFIQQSNVLVSYSKDQLDKKWVHKQLQLDSILQYEIEKDLKYIALLQNKKIMAHYDLKDFQKIRQIEFKDEVKGIHLYNDQIFVTYLEKGNTTINKRLDDDQILPLYEIQTQTQLKSQMVKFITSDQIPFDSLYFFSKLREDVIEFSHLRLKQDQVQRTVKQFYKVEGNILDYEIHPSNEYIVVLSDLGFYYIFNISQGDIRGKQRIEVPKGSLFIDPSGLYLSFITQNETVVMYELAKGNKIYEFNPGFTEIATHQFLNNGFEYIIVDKTRATLKIFELDEKISKVIMRLYQRMQIDQSLWQKYPIHLNTTVQLSDQEKDTLRQMRNLKKPDTHNYHPFLEKSIKQSQTFKHEPRFNEQSAQVSMVSVVPPISQPQASHQSAQFGQIEKSYHRANSSYASSRRPPSRFSKIYQQQDMYNHSYKSNEIGGVDTTQFSFSPNKPLYNYRNASMIDDNYQSQTIKDIEQKYIRNPTKVDIEDFKTASHNRLKSQDTTHQRQYYSLPQSKLAQYAGVNHDQEILKEVEILRQPVKVMESPLKYTTMRESNLFERDDESVIIHTDTKRTNGGGPNMTVVAQAAAILKEENDEISMEKGNMTLDKSEVMIPERQLNFIGGGFDKQFQFNEPLDIDADVE